MNISKLLETRLRIASILIAIVCSLTSVSGQVLTVRDIMAEPSIAGMRIEGEKLSPDGKKVVFLWNAEGRMPRDLYLSSTDKADAKVILRSVDLPRPAPTPTPENKLNYGLVVRDDFVRSRENALGNFEWSPDSTRLLFTNSGDLYVMSLADLKPKRYTKTQSSEAAARFLDDDRIIFSQNGNLFVLNIADATLVQLTREANPQTFISVSGGVPNKAGTLVAYTVSDTSKNRALFVPNYLDEYVQAPMVRRGWGEQRLFVTSADGNRDAPAEIKLPKAEGVSSFRRMVWAADGTTLIVDRLDRDTKRRQLFYVANAGEKGEKITLVTEETDDKWQAPLSAIFEPNPRNPNELFFASEGRSQIVYSSTERTYTEREFYTIYPASGESFGISSIGKGMRTSPQMDERNSEPTLIFGFSQWNRPEDLFSQKICPRCSMLLLPKQLTDTSTAKFSSQNWTQPAFLEIPARDGKKIPAKIYLPPNHNSKKKYPMAIFVHGAGYLQNVINGWNNYYREFMFNDLLAKRGYVVLDIDYRGSAGYGRDWRTDVYDFLGGKDYDDHIDAIDYMVKNYGVNQSKIGVYGGSYGGFMAGMLVMRAPERIAAAAALRPVFDWKNYYAANPQYTGQRLGFPDKNPEAYRRSSPISYADKLERPLLILHGMADDNVHVQDSVQMIEKLIRLGKTRYFDAMLYPSENHAFVRPETWADEYERILALFERHLK
jgi:dipeptidyl aminopeptidase/acylaminoacyl peptidase